MNLYESKQVMINSGTFWRCHHGCTQFNPCGMCGVKHPIKYVRHWWKTTEGGQERALLMAYICAAISIVTSALLLWARLS